MHRLPCQQFVTRGLAAVACSLFLCGCHYERPDSSAVEHVFGQTGLGPGEFSYPRGIAVSPVDGCVFVVDKTARIQRFSPDGKHETGWRMPEWEHGKPTGLSVDRQNRVWVPDTHYSRVMLYDRDGRELMRFGSRGTGPGQFIFPTSVALDCEGFIYVGEYGGNDRISKFASDGRYIMSFADEASGEAWLSRPTEIMFDDHDQLWVTDACHHRLCRFDREGRLLWSCPLAGIDEQRPNFPYGLCLESDGTLVIADHGNNRIVRYDRNGKPLGSWGTTGRAVGQLVQPWDVALSPRGLLYVLDSWNNRVQVIHW